MGCQQRLRDLVSKKISIPSLALKQQKGLNVATATAILVNELRRGSLYSKVKLINEALVNHSLNIACPRAIGVIYAESVQSLMAKTLTVDGSET